MLPPFHVLDGDPSSSLLEALTVAALERTAACLAPPRVATMFFGLDNSCVCVFRRLFSV